MKRLLICVLWAAVMVSPCAAFEEDAYASMRQEMVDRQIEGRGITDSRVLEVIKKVKRHLFVPAYLRNLAYSDRPLPIGCGQTISQPYIVAYMTAAAKIGPYDRVLEIGTGSGYQAAILAQLAKEVYTIELLQPLADSARLLLENIGYSNIEVRQGDGYKGWIERAPFDAIIVTAAPPELPWELADQLKVGGRMVVPVGAFYQELYLITRTGSGFKREPLLLVTFVPMVHSKAE